MNNSPSLNLFKSKQIFKLIKIDLLDALPSADVFDEERYSIVATGDLNKLIELGEKLFIEKNRRVLSYTEWLKNAEDGGAELLLLNQNEREIFRFSVLADPSAKKCLELAYKYHGPQTRKGDEHPYMEHPLEVANILKRAGMEEGLISVGFCHDLLEDTDCPPDEISKVAGDKVLKIVEAVSNDPDLSDKTLWEKKKEKYIQTVKAGGEKAIAVSVADKIANLNAFFEQYQKEGVTLWAKFNRGKDKKILFEKAVLNMAKENWHSPLIRQLENLVDKLDLLETLPE